MMKIRTAVSSAVLFSALLGLSACGDESADKQQTTEVKPAEAQVTVADAEKFVADSEKRLEEISEYGARVAWVNANFVTYDTTQLNAKVGEEYTKLGVELANEAKKFNDLDLPYDLNRKLEMIKLGLTLPAPSDEAKTKKLAEITSKLDSIYATGKSPDGRSLDRKSVV